MTDPVSIRFPSGLAERLRRRSARKAEPTSGYVVRLVDEGMRMEDHPGIAFRDGPAGRRAGLVSGPDVWEVIVALKDFGRLGESRALKKAAAWLGLMPSQVRTAEAYYAEYPEEIDARIAENATAGERARRVAESRKTLYK